MSWPMWSQGQLPVSHPQQTPMAGAYTPEQWAAMQQQNWQQWSQWQQQYSQWQTDYGVKFAEQAALMGVQQPPLPPPQTSEAPPPPPPAAPPPPAPHENNLPLFGIKNKQSLQVQPTKPANQAQPNQNIPGNSNYGKQLQGNQKYQYRGFSQVNQNLGEDLSRFNRGNNDQSNQNRGYSDEGYQNQDYQDEDYQEYQQEPDYHHDYDDEEYDEQGYRIDNRDKDMIMGNGKNQQYSNRDLSNQRENDGKFFEGAPKGGSQLGNSNYNDRIRFTEDSNSNKDNSGNKNWSKSNNATNLNTKQDSGLRNANEHVNSQQSSVISEEEKQFDVQFEKWEDEFQKWKEANVNHPDRGAYREYEQKFEACRAQLLERRKQMLMKRTQKPPALLDKPPAPSLDPIPQTVVPPPRNANPHTSDRSRDNFNHNLNFNEKNKTRPDDRYIIEDDYDESMGTLFPLVDKSKGIPGLDLVDDRHAGTKQDNDNIVIEQKKLRHGSRFGPVIEVPTIAKSEPSNLDIPILPDLSSILGDKNFMNVLSMVQKGGIPKPNNSQVPTSYGKLSVCNSGIPGLMDMVVPTPNMVPAPLHNQPQMSNTQQTGQSIQHNRQINSNSPGSQQPAAQLVQQNRHVNPNVPGSTQPKGQLIQQNRQINSNVPGSQQISRLLPGPQGLLNQPTKQEQPILEPIAQLNRFNQQMQGGFIGQQIPHNLINQPMILNQNMPIINQPLQPDPGHLQLQGMLANQSLMGQQIQVPLVNQQLQSLLSNQQLLIGNPTLGLNIPGHNLKEKTFQQATIDQLLKQQQKPTDFYNLTPSQLAAMKAEEPSWANEPLLEPFIFVDYNHKPARSKAKEFFEPSQTFDYNHVSKTKTVVTSLLDPIDRRWKELEEFSQRSGVKVIDYQNKSLKDDSMKYNREDDYSTKRGRFDGYGSRNNRSQFEDDRGRPDDRKRSWNDSRRDLRESRESDRRSREKDFRQSDRGRQSDRSRPSRDKARASSRERERKDYSKDRDRKMMRDLLYSDKSSGDRDNKDRHEERSDSEEVQIIEIEDPGIPRIIEPSVAPAPVSIAKQEQKIVMIDDILEEPGRQMRPEKIAIIMRGLPGSGKSYLAKLIKDREVEKGGSAPRILSLDDYFLTEVDNFVKDENTGKRAKVTEQRYEYDATNEESYLKSLTRAFKRTLCDGYFSFIILDGPNELLKTVAECNNFAKQSNFQVYICDMDCDITACHKRNIHNRSLEDVQVIFSRFQPTPRMYTKLDCTTLLQNAAIDDVHMEDVCDDDVMINEQPQEDDEEVATPLTSKWDKMDDVDKLARLDGTSKPLRSTAGTMEDYLQLDDWEAEKVAQPGKKRVRWADIEEKRTQEKMRAIGFVVGQTNWDRMTDPTQGSSALTQTKYIERISRH